jgi:hypothetical protein
MGEKSINPVHNVFKKYKQVIYVNPYLFESSLDADANAYITATGITGAEKDSTVKIFTDLKANNLYSKIQALYLFKGTSGSQHKYNAKNPINSNSAFRLEFFGSGTFSNLGYQLNNSNSFADTFFIPSVNQNINSNGATIVIGTNNTAGADTYEFGSIIGSSYSFMTSKRENAVFGQRARMNNGLLERQGVNDAKGVLTAVRQNSLTSKLFKNGIAIATDDLGGGSLPPISQFVGCVNLNGGSYGHSTQRIQMVIIHEGLSDAEVVILHNIINASETIAGRKTW